MSHLKLQQVYPPDPSGLFHFRSVTISFVSFHSIDFPCSLVIRKHFFDVSRQNVFHILFILLIFESHRSLRLFLMICHLLSCTTSMTEEYDATIVFHLFV